LTDDELVRRYEKRDQLFIALAALISLSLAVVPLLTTIRPPVFISEEASAQATYATLIPTIQAVGLVFSLALMALAFRNSRDLVAAGWKQSVGRILLPVFSFGTFGMLILNGTATPVIYLGVLWCHLGVFYAFWQLPERTKQVTLQVFVAANVGFMLIALFVYPHTGRYLGGIHPNLFGQVTITTAVFAGCVTRRWIRTAVLVLCFYGAVVVSSRVAILGLTAVSLVVLALWLRQWISYTAVLLVLLLFVPAVVLLEQEIGFFRSLLLLDDLKRGLDSGISGRDRLWDNFWPQLDRVTYSGFGFRSRVFRGTHNGFMNILLENGVVLGSMIIGLIAALALYGVAVGVRALASPFDRLAMITAVLALYVGSLQPQILSFGDIGGLSLILIMAYPFRQSLRTVRESQSNQEMDEWDRNLMPTPSRIDRGGGGRSSQDSIE
jgi:hypothetical protein